MKHILRTELMISHILCIIKDLINEEATATKPKSLLAALAALTCLQLNFPSPGDVVLSLPYNLIFLGFNLYCCSATQFYSVMQIHMFLKMYFSFSFTNRNLAWVRPADHQECQWDKTNAKCPTWRNINTSKISINIAKHDSQGYCHHRKCKLCKRNS